MSRRRRIIDLIKGNAVACLALFVALGGSAYAANTVFSTDIVDGQVKSVDIGTSEVLGVDVAFDTLTGADIAENSLSLSAMGCKTGKILGFARVKGTAGIPAFYTNAAAAIDITNNCSGGAVEVRRAGTGKYFVRFAGNPALLALVSANSDGFGTNSTHNDNIVSVAKVTSGADAGAFRVEVEDVDGGASNGSDPQDGQFTIMLP
jgi:hypothetical protein